MKRIKRWQVALGISLALIAGVAFGQYAVGTNYTESGGSRTVIGGSIDVASGGEIDIESGGSLKIAGTSVDATAAELNEAADASFSGAVTAGGSSVTTYTYATDGASMALDVVANEFTLTAATTGTAVFMGADASSPANTTFSTTGAGSIVVGGGAVLAVTITTDDTGDGTDLVLPANGVDSSEINTIVQSIYWGANELSADGAQCVDAVQESTIAGAEVFVIVCADNDAGLIGGSVIMPDSWNGGTVTFEYMTIQTAAETLVVDGDMEVQCRGDGETPVDTWSAEVAMLDAAQIGSGGIDHIQTASAITPDGTCAGGDWLAWQYSVDATGTTATVATNNFIGFKMEYTSDVGD